MGSIGTQRRKEEKNEANPQRSGVPPARVRNITETGRRRGSPWGVRRTPARQGGPLPKEVSEG